MKTIDMRFDLSLIKRWIGKKLIQYKNDPFEFTNSVTQIIGLYIDEDIYSLTNIQEKVDYFGTTDDIAVFKISQSNNSQIVSALKDVEMIITPVNDVIKSIRVINEKQKITQNEEDSYEVWLTRAIIISVGGREISFEKDTVPFSEEIIIRKGYNLAESIADNSSFMDGWDEGIVPECKREIIDIS